MSLIEYFQLLFSDYTLRTITLGTGILGAICGVLGSFAVLKRQSLLGDAISHAALPGIVIAFLLTYTKENNLLLLGALISGLIGTIWITGITKRTHLKMDTALGIVLSVFFGLGMLLLTYIQKLPNANQAGLDKYLFGQAATLMVSDVKLLAVVFGISLLVVLIFWKEFKILLFDLDYSKAIGINTKFLEMIILSFIVLAIILGLQTVGVVLMSAMLLAPAAAARQWTNKLSFMLFLAALFGVFSGIIGTGISATQYNMATGPVIVLVAMTFVLISMIFAPNRGILSKRIRFYKNRRQLRQSHTLILMYNIVQDHEDFSHPHQINLLNNFQGFTSKTLNQLENEGWIKTENNTWSLTSKGFEYAKKLNEFKKDTEE